MSENGNVVGVCVSCEMPIEVSQAIVGLPVIRIKAPGKSAMAGTELLFHVSCFVSKMKTKKIELIKAS